MEVNEPRKDITLEHLANRVDSVTREVQKLIEVTKKSSRMTITDGIALGVGMFIALPIVLFLIGVILAVSGISLGPFFRH